MSRYYIDLNGERLFYPNNTTFQRDHYEVVLKPISGIGTTITGTGPTVVAAWCDLDERVAQAKEGR